MARVPNLYILALIIITAWIGVPAQTAALSAETETNTVTRSEFETRVRQYTARREALERQLPPLPKQATAEQIAAHKNRLLKKVMADRKRVVRGNIFTKDAEAMIRSIILNHYPGRDRAELKKELAEAENKSVPVRVNIEYPETAELLEMPPTLLLALPQLPKQVRYRFVGNSLLLVDRESHLIVDYMTNALP
jgi:enamine deaminase RidA (YjgF/YER057c/UK114 family)